MRRNLIWLANNALVAIAMVAVSAMLAALHQSTEISGGNYRTLAEAWPRMKPAARKHLVEAMVDGSISRWEYTPLIREIVEDVSVVEVYADTDQAQAKKQLEHEVAASGYQRQ